MRDLRPGREDTRRRGRLSRGAIEDDLVALRAEIEGFLAEPPERASTLTRRLQAFEELRGKARLYYSVLTVHVKDLEASDHISRLPSLGVFRARS
jgi:hypothetical protein